MSKWLKILAGITTLLSILSLLSLLIVVILFQIEAIWITLIVIFFALYCLNVLFGTYIYFNSRRKDLTKKSWLFSLLLFPGFAILIFLWTGFNPFTKNKIQLLQQHKQYIIDVFNNKKNKEIKSKNEYHNIIFRYASNLTVNPTTMGNFTFIDKANIYKEVINIIRKAKKVIFINFYIFADGIFGRSILNELFLKQKSGVKIFFLYDWVGCRKKIDKKIFKILNEYRIETYTFRKKSAPIVNSIDSPRNHKKSIIIDGKEALLGGYNVADEYINLAKKYHYWRDHCFHVKGNVINDLLKNFLLDWKAYTQVKDTSEIEQIITELVNENIKSNDNNLQIVQTYNSFPEENKFNAMNLYAMAFSQAKKRIWINTPYFYPTEQLTNIFINMASAGVDVRIIVPGLPDNKKFIVDINRSKYKLWKQNGVKVYEFNGFTHCKSIIIDDDISIIGTVNMDPRALNINYEMANIVESKKLNNKLAYEFEETVSHSIEINHINKNKSLIKKIYGKMLVVFLLFFEPLL